MEYGKSASQSYLRGVTYALLGGVALSSSGLFVRHIEHAEPYTVLFYRSMAFFITVLCFMLVRDRRGVLRMYRNLRWSDLVVSVSLACGFILYLVSLFYTSVANTVLLLSTGPFFAALLGWLVLRERVASITWVAMGLAAFGIAVMVSDGVDGDDLRGIVLAMAAVSTFAVMLVALRRAGPGRDMLAATSLGGPCAALICIPLMAGFQISSWDLIMAIGLGTVQVGAGFIMLTLATRSVPSAQVALLALGETALAPLWVWLVVNEIPARNTLIGGAIILAAVVFQGVLGVRRGA